MLYITICDDEKAQLALLNSSVTGWGRLQKYELEIHLCQNAGQFLFWQEGHKESDIMLLDTDMPGMDGLSPAKELRFKGESLQIFLSE